MTVAQSGRQTHLRSLKKTPPTRAESRQFEGILVLTSGYVIRSANLRGPGSRRRRAWQPPKILPCLPEARHKSHQGRWPAQWPKRRPIWGLRTAKFRGPAFCAADLRLIGDLCSDPLTTAIRNDILALHVPAWSDDARQVLVLLGEKLSDAVAVAIRKSVLPLVETPSPSQGLLAVESTFALSRPLHLFRAEPSVTWATFSEPQLTKGFAHFIKRFRGDRANPEGPSVVEGVGRDDA